MTEPTQLPPARLQLKTVAVRPDGCFSALLWDGKPFAVSVERTFEDVRPIIGNGSYDCQATVFQRGGYATFEILVDGHTRILFHKGNTEVDSVGCVVLGTSFGQLNGQTAVLGSQGAYDTFMQLTKGLKSFTMEVSGR